MASPLLMFNSLASIVLIFSSSASLMPLGAAPSYEPISDQAYEADLEDAGLRNGAMPDLRMIEVNGCTLERDAAYTLSLMVEAAKADGVDLSPGDCYRSYSQQEAAYDKRCPEVEHQLTKLDLATGDTVTVGVMKVRECSGPPIAKPGASNHGWGRAVDFTRNGRSTLDCNDAAFEWLDANGAEFGWVHPPWAHCGRASAEPWHWEFGGAQPAPPAEPGTSALNQIIEGTQ